MRDKGGEKSMGTQETYTQVENVLDTKIWHCQCL